ncbi:MAG: O-antigen ligase family protein [Bryobacteraceae bacterium]
MSASSLPVLVLVTAATVAIARPERGFAQAWELGAILLAGFICLRGIPAPQPSLTSLTLFGAALWASIQLAAGWTASAERTAAAAAQFAALGAIVLAADCRLRSHADREACLRVAAVLGGVAAVVCLLQPYATGISHDEFAGPFQNRNTYCAFVELLLPVAIWRADREPDRRWIWWTVAALMAASAIATGSRAGSVLVSTEAAILLVFSRRQSRIVPALLIALVVAGAGWETLGWRIRLSDPIRPRAAMISSALSMAGERPLTGFGAGAFIDAYPKFATYDSGRIVNHAHNDWAEFAAEGGIPFAILLAIPFLAALRRMKPQTSGTLFVLLHSLVDYPMQRAGMAVWVWLFVAVAASTRLKRPGARPAPAARREPVVRSDRSLATAER